MNHSYNKAGGRKQQMKELEPHARHDQLRETFRFGHWWKIICLLLIVNHCLL